MSELRSALDALTTEDLHGLDDGLVLDRVAELVTAQNRIAAELTRAVRHAELTRAAEHDGLTSMRSWLIGHVRLAPAEASRIVRSGRVLAHFPALASGFAEGHVTAEQVDVVAREGRARGAGPGRRAERGPGYVRPGLGGDRRRCPP